MGQTINPVIQSVDIQPGENLGEQIITLVLRHTGSEDLSGLIIQGEELSIELPSHAPPPEKKSGKKENDDKE